jgi:hypothetical protein
VNLTVPKDAVGSDAVASAQVTDQAMKRGVLCCAWPTVLEVANQRDADGDVVHKLVSLWVA